MAQSFRINRPDTYEAVVRKRGGSSTITVPHILVQKMALRPGVTVKIELYDSYGRSQTMVTTLKANQHILYFPIPGPIKKSMGLVAKESVVDVKIERYEDGN